MRNKLAAMIFLILPAVFSGCGSSGTLPDLPPPEDYPPWDWSDVTTVYVWEPAVRDMPHDELLFAEAIQGIVNREKPQLYINFHRFVKTYDLWLTEIHALHGFEIVTVTDIWDLAEIFKDRINGYVVYPELYTETMNYAATIAGVLNALPISRRLVSTARSRGFKQLDNAANYTGIDRVIEKYGARLNKKMFLNIDTARPTLRDYGIKHRAIMVWPSEQAGLQPVYNFLEKPALLYGWFNDGQGSEMGGIREASINQLVTIPSDWALNMSFLEEPSESVLKQPEPIDKDLKAQAGKHYITFSFTDGDNIQWLIGGFTDPRFYGYDRSIQVPFGWSLTPTLLDYAPVIMDYIYKTAVPADNFHTALGYGYIHPSKFTQENLIWFGERTAGYMRRADQHYMDIFDNDPAAVRQSAAVWDAFTRHDQIKGIMYKTGADTYLAGKGYLEWSNDKPVVAFREMLWDTTWTENERIKDSNIYQMAYRISQYDKDPAKIDGYTLVAVHCWTHDYGSVIKMADWFKENDPDVVIVTPDTFMRLITENVPKTNANPVKNYDDSWDYSSVSHLYRRNRQN